MPSYSVIGHQYVTEHKDIDNIVQAASELDAAGFKLIASIVSTTTPHFINGSRNWLAYIPIKPMGFEETPRIKLCDWDVDHKYFNEFPNQNELCDIQTVLEPKKDNTHFILNLGTSLKVKRYLKNTFNLDMLDYHPDTIMKTVEDVLNVYQT